MEKVGRIYKYTNLINGKIYIGQTTQTLERRHAKHLCQLSDNTYFHRALEKYGAENFKLELVEDNIPCDELDEREKYWINEYESFYTLGKGYNLTAGGKWGSGTQKIISKQAEEIKNLIRNHPEKTFSQIGEIYGLTVSGISDINTGRSFYDPNIEYPIRKPIEKSELNYDKVNEIIDLLRHTDMNYKNIGLKVGVKEYTVGEINRGNNSWCPVNLDYPIRKSVKPNTYQNVIDQNAVIEICHELIYTDITLKDIGEKYHIARNTVGDISRGISWKEITNQFVCPIRKNKEKNKSIYEIIYGIV